MAKANMNSVSPALLDKNDVNQEHSVAADLAWEYSKRLRRGENVSKDDFRVRLYSQRSREEFDLLTGMDEFLERMVEHQVRNCDSRTN